MNDPLVSVVMANYNTPEEYLREAIESVLNQTYKNLEFIIVDDASTKNDIEIIRSYRDKRIVLLQNERNRKTAFSANRGLAKARGAFIARMDSDDICAPYRIEKQVGFFRNIRRLISCRPGRNSSEARRESMQQISQILPL